jgi:hypothetical protein
LSRPAAKDDPTPQIRSTSAALVVPHNEVVSAEGGDAGTSLVNRPVRGDGNLCRRDHTIGSHTVSVQGLGSSEGAVLPSEAA